MIDALTGLSSPASKSPASVKRRIELDFVRGIAILLAMGWHFNGNDTGYAMIDMLLKPGRTLGWAGVDLFFVLSGFLVGGLIFSEYAKSGAFNARRFLIRRAFKIWPVLYLYIGLVVVTGRYPWREVIPQTLFHVQNFFETPLSHLWSLAVEEHFYLMFATLFSWFLKRSNARIDAIPAFLICVMIGAPLLRAAALIGGVSAHDIHIQTQFRVDALACGVFLAHLKIFHASRFEKIVRRKFLWGTLTVVGLTFLLQTQDVRALLVTTGYSASYLTGAAFLLLTYQARLVINANPASRVMAWIGMYSYPMYVFQFVAYRSGEAAWHRLAASSLPPVALLILQYAGAILVAVAVTKLLEQPALKLRDHLFPSATVP